MSDGVSTETKAISLLHPRFVAARKRLPTNTLGCIEFGDCLSVSKGPGAIPHLTVPMARSNQESFVESWSSTAPRKEGGTRGDLIYSEDGEYLFITTIIAEGDDYDKAAESRYRQIFELIADLGYSRLFRIWNYIGNMLDTAPSGLQFYQEFVKGRERAFANYGGTKLMPAATGIGTRGSGIGLVALASRTGVPTHVENPRQTPAYEYPEQYGPKAPSFARATVLNHNTASESYTQSLYVSGTSSILGHESVYCGDFNAQLTTTLENLAALVDGKNLARFKVHKGFDLTDASLMKVYVKRSTDITKAYERVHKYVGKQTDVRYLNVDICRKELLVEIEAVFPSVSRLKEIK